MRNKATRGVRLGDVAERDRDPFGADPAGMGAGPVTTVPRTVTRPRVRSCNRARRTRSRPTTGSAGVGSLPDRW